MESGGVRVPPMPASAQAYFGNALLNESIHAQLWVTGGIHQLERLAECFRTFAPDAKVFTLPPFEKNDMDAQSARLEALRFLEQKNQTPFILIAAESCLAETFPSLGAPLKISTGGEISPDRLIELLNEQGYSLDVEVYEKGAAARRGGIIDVWPPVSPLPVRIEFFGDEIESLRTFDPDTQRSVEKIDSVDILPLNAAGELRLDELIPENTVCFFSGVDAPPEPVARSSVYIGDVTSNAIDTGLGAYDTNLKPVSELNKPDMLEQQRKRFFDSLVKMASGEWRVDIYLETPGALERLREAYFGSESKNRKSEIGNHQSVIQLHVGLLHGSFISKHENRIVITEADIYGYAAKTAHVRRGVKQTKAAGARVAEWADIQPGELVVHVDHGIGKYMGLVEMEMSGRRQEMLLIEYAEGARIYLPTAQAHLLMRYVGIGNAAPALHSLKGQRWQNERKSAQTAIEDLAAVLLETQAARALKKGRACGTDTHWQKEFENAFPYMETPDQLAAIKVVKSDLESAQPMDRLICGDAGYGKTEVAMRAAFKMVMERRQVALLVPTTILAQQHFDTFTERMAAYPVRIEMLSRFRTRAEQNETVERLREGKTDIIIGTHRLVSNDVQFADLGLVIIDEEQRFGVRAKEHLKQIRKQVDILTLSATPIPRTLYMSLTGARDMSTIQTPPQERQPVETIVLEYHEDIITEAVRHELARDGQVFYLHNRVQTIGKTAAKIHELVPEARVEFAHGQMSERELSEVMHRFVRGLFDVLVCTTIVESGVDIPRVNTIIIDHADRFGLADLYQLRGRVGRARQKAYAFLLLPPGGVLSDDSRRRIEALKKYTGHGTGFRIAMRDLEIRGAGNLLGAQQSGHIAAIGFDLYCQLLKRSVARLNGEKVPPVIDVSVDLDFLERSPAAAAGGDGAYIPYQYIDDENLRVKLYGRLATLAAEQEIRELKKEFADRFGALPAAVKNLFDIARIRIAAAGGGIQSVRASDDRLIIIRHSEALMPAGRYPRLTSRTTPAKLKEIHRFIKKLL